MILLAALAIAHPEPHAHPAGPVSRRVLSGDPGTADVWYKSPGG